MADEGGDLDSWEDQADSGLFDKRLDEMSVDIQQSEKMKSAAKGHMVLTEESSATQYQPKVRILKRDTKASTAADMSKSSSSGSSSSKSNKSLQQREAEYAEARMRIFGCVSPDEEEVEETNSNGESDKNNSSVMIQGVPQIFKSTVTTVPVLRQPRGPDGTGGFNKAENS